MTQKDDTIKAGVTQVLQQLYDAHGEAKSTQLVEAARPKSSPAHRGFEWDDKRAAHEHRLNQARQWIRQIKIVTEAAPEGERLVHVPRISMAQDLEANSDSSGKDGVYQALSVVVKRPDEFARALDEALGKLRAARRALDELYAASEHTGRANGAAQVAQMAKATELFAQALSAMH